MSSANFSHDLVVIGGGPAGCAAAITAARAGGRVLLLERESFPRHKVCGEFVSPESLQVLRSLLAEGAPHVLDLAPRIPFARIFVEDHCFEVEVDPPAASIARYQLDHALWQAALAAGVDARLGVSAQDVSLAHGFRIKSSAGEFCARAVVDASGRWSNLRAASGAEPKDFPREKWIGLKAHFRAAEPAEAVELYFFSGGYCGIQPVGQQTVNACAMVRPEKGRTLEQVFAQHPDLWRRSRDWELAFPQVATAPLIFGVPQPLRGGVPCAGDAAGFIDPFAGDGISLALHGGVLAADSLAVLWRVPGSSLEAATAGYAAAWELAFSPAFRNSARLRGLLAWPRPLRNLALSAFRFPSTRRYLVRATRARAG